jgi:hypothetical protein
MHRELLAQIVSDRPTLALACLDRPSRASGELVNLEPLHAKRRRPSSDDELLAHLLIHTWILITGRMLRSDVPPQDLTEQELIEFWADDYLD